MGSSESQQVIVIGSGIAGMAAAWDLAQKGHSITVLQANDYIGGRLKSRNIQLSKNSTFAFDYGASWIHGSCDANPITKLSKYVSGVKTIQTLDDSIINFDEQGKQVEEQVQKQFQAYQQMQQKMNKFKGVSVYEAFQNINGDKLKNKYFMYNISNGIQFQTSAPLNDLSAQHGQDDEQYLGKQMLICSGYQKFPEQLSHHQKIKVFLNHKVVQVNYIDGKTHVRCQNGSTFEAAYLIISTPLGVLKSNSIRFSPELPSWKQSSIQNLHFGNVCKILIILKNKNIQQKQHYIGVISNDVNQRGSATYFLNLSGIASIPAMMTFGLGKNADDLEMMPQYTLKQLIAKRMNVFSEQKFTPNDFQILRTNWRSDPNFKGTYTYSGVQTKPNDWRNVAKPIFSNHWYFCGQHTHSKYRGTVHGAYLSGRDVASVILNNVNQSNWEYKGATQDKGDQSEEQNEESQQQNRKQQEGQKGSQYSKQESNQQYQQDKKKKKKYQERSEE